MADESLMQRRFKIERLRKEYEFRETTLVLAGRVFGGTSAKAADVWEWMCEMHDLEREYERRVRDLRKEPESLPVR